jgi:hypothetical protein
LTSGLAVAPPRQSPNVGCPLGSTHQAAPQSPVIGGAPPPGPPEKSKMCSTVCPALHNRQYFMNHPGLPFALSAPRVALQSVPVTGGGTAHRSARLGKCQLWVKDACVSSTHSPFARKIGQGEGPRARASALGWRTRRAVRNRSDGSAAVSQGCVAGARLALGGGSAGLAAAAPHQATSCEAQEWPGLCGWAPGLALVARVSQCITRAAVGKEARGKGRGGLRKQ